MILVGLLLRIALRVIAGILGRKVSVALAVAFLGIQAARATGAERGLSRARAWVRSLRRVRPSGTEGGT